MSGLPVIETNQLRIRPWHADDAPSLHAAMQDAEIQRWLGDGRPYTRADAEGFIERTAARWEAGTAAHFAVADLADDRVVGYVGVLHVEDEIWEIVYWTAPDARGRGVASTALSSLLPWIDTTIGPSRLEAGMLAGNDGSAAVAGRSGFVLDEVRSGTGTLDGEPADEWIYVRA